MTSRQRWTLAAVCVSTALLLVNVAAPNVALEDIAKDLDASFTDLQWVLSGYSLVLAVFQLTAGSLADLFGRKRLFVGGLCLFTAASSLCALAPSAAWLIAMRALQGLGAAIVFPSSLALLAQEFEGAQRGRAIGIWGAVIGLAFAAGPLVGGLLVEPFGWQAIFVLGVVLGVPTIAFAVRHVRESRDPDPKPVDWPGVATLSTGLFLVVFAVLRGNALGWTSAPVLGLVAAGLVFLAAFVAVELRVAAPMLDLRLFRNRTFLGATVIVAIAVGRLVRRVRLPVPVHARRAPWDAGRGRPVARAARGRGLRGLARRRAAERARAAARRARGRHGADGGRAAADDRARREVVVAGRAGRARRRRRAASGSPTRSSPSPTSACCRRRRAASPRASTTRPASSAWRSGSRCSGRCCRAGSRTASSSARTASARRAAP